MSADPSPSGSIPLPKERKPSYELPKRWRMPISREKWVKIRAVMQLPSGRFLPGLFFATFIGSVVYQTAIYYYKGPTHPRCNWTDQRGDLDPEVKRKGDIYRQYLRDRVRTTNEVPLNYQVQNYTNVHGKGFF